MFNLDTGLIFWTGISFAILIFLLYRIVFPPLQDVIAKRKKHIEGGIEQAKNAQKEAEDLLKLYQSKLSEAEKRTSYMFEDARRKSETMRDETVKKAQKEAYNIIENTKRDIDLFKRKALRDMKADIANIVVDVGRKLIKKNLNVKDQVKLVESSIKELEKNAKRKV